MQDRISTYPGRIRLVPVTGQEHVYDMAWADEPQVEGTGINKANLLPDTVAALSGFSSPDTTVADVLQKSLRWRELARFEDAGVVEWTAPDLYGDGREYEVGFWLVGAGGNGLANYGSSSGWLLGGSSGFSFAGKATVTPGQMYSGVVAANGETTSFLGGLADSGSNGAFNAYPQNLRCWGAQVSPQNPATASGSTSAVPFGGLVSNLYNYNEPGFVAAPAQTTNPFTNENILGAGGCYAGIAPSTSLIPGGKNPQTGLGGGDTGYRVNGEDASAPGCGGGSAVKSSSSQAITAGMGAPGAIYIYV